MIIKDQKIEKIKDRIKDFMTLNRMCGICGCLLTKENTGDLQYLQPDCNKCSVDLDKYINKLKTKEKEDMFKSY